MGYRPIRISLQVASLLALAFLCLQAEARIPICLLALAFLAAAEWCRHRPGLRLGSVSAPVFGGALWSLWGLLLAAPYLARWELAKDFPAALLMLSLVILPLLVWAVALASLRLPAPWHVLRGISWICMLGLLLWMLGRPQWVLDMSSFRTFRGAFLALMWLTVVLLAIHRDQDHADAPSAVGTGLMLPGILLLILMEAWSEGSRLGLQWQRSWGWVAPMAALVGLLLTLLWLRVEKQMAWLRYVAILACGGLLWKQLTAAGSFLALSQLDDLTSGLLMLLALALAVLNRSSRQIPREAVATSRFTGKVLFLLAFCVLLMGWGTRRRAEDEIMRLIILMAWFLLAVSGARWADHRARESPSSRLYPWTARCLVVAWAVGAMASYLPLGQFPYLFQLGMVRLSLFLIWVAALAALELEGSWRRLRGFTWAVGAFVFALSGSQWSLDPDLSAQLASLALMIATFLSFALAWFPTPTQPGGGARSGADRHAAAD